MSGVSSVTGKVFNDTNNNDSWPRSSRDPGVTVSLYSAGNDGILGTADDVVVGSAVTDVNGDYTFPGIADGSYEIRVSTATLPSAAYLETGEGNAPGSACASAACDSKVPVTVSGANPTAQYFGYLAITSGVISGTVCSGNGTVPCTGGELNGVTVLLTFAGADGILGTADDVVTAQITSGAGAYSFTVLAPGNYQITKINPAGTTSLMDADAGNPNNISVSLAAGQTASVQDFKVTGALGVIGDTVWIDANNDGVYQANEAGLPGVTMYLCTTSPCNNANKVASTITGPTGSYLFSGLAAGNYYVGVEPTTVASEGLTEVAYPAVNPSTVITLAAGAAYLGADFGYKPGTNKVVLGDTVWYDANGDGVQQAGEAGSGTSA